MRRTLTLAALAKETNSEAGLLERLAAVGVIAPDVEGMYTSGDIIRVEAVKSFLDAGVTIEKIEEAIEHGLFTFEYLDRFHPEPSPPSDRDLRQFADSFGLDLSLLKSIYLAMGLAEPSDDDILTTEEEEILTRFVDVWERGGEAALVRAARLVGEPARLLSEGWTRLYVEKIAPEHTVGPLDDRIRTIVDTTEKAALLAPAMFQWLLQTHLRRAIDQANVEGLEETMREHGLSLPLPDILPAVAFVDISGYTRMTELEGDTHAVRSSDVVRERSQRAGQRHGGRLVKLLGDGSMLYFDQATNAVGAVVELVEALFRDGLPAHAGIHAGSLIEHDGDYYGSTVNLAARIADQAVAGEVLVSAAVVHESDSSGLVFEPRQQVRLKGIDEPVELYGVSKAEDV
ncbi:MAG TPA: adenylate/guanylate cyclase domain-containing protein [Acidimicrobiia bacterium]